MEYFKAGSLAPGSKIIAPVTVAAQRWTYTSFHLLSPDVRASGHLEFRFLMFDKNIITYLDIKAFYLFPAIQFLFGGDGRLIRFIQRRILPGGA